MGLGALVKPPPPTAGPPGRSAAAPASVQPAQPAQRAPSSATRLGAAAVVGFPDPNQIAACLAPLGYSTGKLQKVPLGLWQAVSAKQLGRGDGDVNLFVSGPSPSIATTVELEANAPADGWQVARAELLRALPVLFEHLRLSPSAELVQAIEGDAGERAIAAEFVVGDVTVRYATRPNGDLRTARVSLTRK